MSRPTIKSSCGLDGPSCEVLLKITNKSPTRCNDFFSLLSRRLFTAQDVLGVFPPIIRSSMTAVAASGFAFVSWWQSCCVRGRAGYGESECLLENCCIWLVICLNCRMMHGLTNLNPFRSYIGPRPTVWFSSSAPMSEAVRHSFCCVCLPAVGACPTLFLM
jgi:hypothetical protein